MGVPRARFNWQLWAWREVATTANLALAVGIAAGVFWLQDSWEFAYGEVYLDQGHIIRYTSVERWQQYTNPWPIR